MTSAKVTIETPIRLRSPHPKAMLAAHEPAAGTAEANGTTAGMPRADTAVGIPATTELS
jgi:hypothetical protein